MLNAQAKIKGSYSLAIVSFFNRTDNQLDFFDGIKTFLIIESQFNWLEDYRDIPVNPSAKWKKKYKFAIYTMKA